MLAERQRRGARAEVLASDVDQRRADRIHQQQVESVLRGCGDHPVELEIIARGSLDVADFVVHPLVHRAQTREILLGRPFSGRSRDVHL